MRTALLIGSLAGLLVLAMAFGGYAWWRMAEVAISMHGLIALGLGIVLSLLLGAGLMALVFYSSRSGHDERQNRPGD